MAEYTALRPLFSDIANAIREKDGSTGTIPAETFPDRIRGIQSTSELTQQSAKVWTPTTQDQIIPAETYLTGAQTIQGDPNLIASNIKEGVPIFGVMGNATTKGTINVLIESNWGYGVTIYYTSPNGAETVYVRADQTPKNIEVIENSIGGVEGSNNIQLSKVENENVGLFAGAAASGDYSNTSSTWILQFTNLDAHIVFNP